jgi:hypothetical protein
MINIHETKTRRHCVVNEPEASYVRYRTASCGNFAASCRSNRAQLNFSGIGRTATHGTANNVNASVEKAGFDFSGTAWYRTVSERYLTR